MFRAILTAQRWEGSLQAFKHFLVERVRFNSDPDQGHGALCRHSHPMTAYASMGRIQTNADPSGSTICRLAASPARLALTSELLTTRNGTAS